MRLRLICTLAVAAVLGSAAPVSFNGSFSEDDDMVAFAVRLNAAGTLTAQTDSFANGGFAPVLSLFEATGLQQLLALTYGGIGAGCPGLPADAATGFCWDASLSVPLVAGDYLLVLTQDDNLPFGPTFADGFLRAGTGNFTGPTFLGTPGSFTLVSGHQRTPEWSLTIDGADDVARTDVPEPGTFALQGTALAGLLAWAIWRRSAMATMYPLRLWNSRTLPGRLRASS
jgi:hypothetical protein